MQRRERHEALELFGDLRIDAHGFRKLDSAVHDAVTDSDQTVVLTVLAQELDDVCNSPGVTKTCSIVPFVAADLLPRRTFRGESRRGVQRLDLPFENERDLLATLAEQRELDAR